MCGIVGIVSNGTVADRLIEGLRKLEYRGYDSAGIAVINGSGAARRRANGPLVALQEKLSLSPIDGQIGIAHTRWATHGAPNTLNAHPHTSGRVNVVHNGIIENYQYLRGECEALGRHFESDTDSEVIAHLMDINLSEGWSTIVSFERTLKRLEGAYAIAMILEGHNNLLLGARKGSPLVIGVGTDEAYLGSDAIALSGLTREVIYLEEGDVVALYPDKCSIKNSNGALVERPSVRSSIAPGAAEKGNYQHFMLKEIHEQPEVITRTLAASLDMERSTISLEEDTVEMLAGATRGFGIACGTAFYAGAISRTWFEHYASLPFEVDIASEFRYRKPVLREGGLGLFVSQSGETADTLAAMRYCKANQMNTIGIVNVPESTLAREADQVVHTQAGVEIGVASTKAFISQLTILATLSIAAGKSRGQLSDDQEARLISQLLTLPRLVSETLKEESNIAQIALDISSSRSALFLGRGANTFLAMEGALKLKEVSYIHAEGYAAGELKHGPIALIEEGTPVVVVAPSDDLFGKTLSNIAEVKARGAKVILISDGRGLEKSKELVTHGIQLPEAEGIISPFPSAVALQLLAYHTAVALGADVDKPRNLAKSVTVE